MFTLIKEEGSNVSPILKIKDEPIPIEEQKKKISSDTKRLESEIQRMDNLIADIPFDVMK